MLVMLGAMLLQPLIGHLLDWSYANSHTTSVLGGLMHDQNARQLYSVRDYQLAMSIIPIGILIAAVLTFFLRETHAHAKHNHP
jgi:hypothetical protein